MVKRATAMWVSVMLMGCDGSATPHAGENIVEGDANAHAAADGGSVAGEEDAAMPGVSREEGALNGGWDGIVPAPGTLRINEVDCNGDRVELINTGSSSEDLSRYAIADDLTALDHRVALTGSLEPGAYTVVTLVDFGLKCGTDNTFLLRGEELYDVARAALVPGNASFGRLPDAVGEFVRNRPTLGAVNAVWVDESPALFTPFAAPVTVALVIDGANEAALNMAPRSYAHALATIQAGGQSVGPIDIGVRLKGSLGSFRSLAAKAALKLDADRFVPGHSFFGLSKLTFNNLAQDPSTIHEWLGYQLFAAVGVPVPRVGYAQVTINGQPYGTYVLLEDTTEKIYLESQFGATTGLYEPPAGADVTPEQIGTFDVEEGDPADLSGLRAVAEPLANGTRLGWFDALGTKVAWPEVLRLQAADITHGNGDGYAYARNNYMVHLDGAGTMRMLPWGIDASFIAQLDYFRTQSLLLSRCFEEPRCVALWLAALEDVYAKDTALLTPAFLAQARMLGQLNTQRFAGDTRWDHTSDAIPNEVENTLSRLLGNLAHLKERIDCQRNANADSDGDGVRCELDCDDGDNTRYRGAAEVCGDRIDQNCNGVADDGETCPACLPHPDNGALFVCPRAMTMVNLREACGALGAAPLTVASAAENASFTAAFSGWFRERSFFIGMSDEALVNSFVWVAGSSANYRNFVDGFPFARNVGQGPRCVTMSETGGWRTEQCDTRVPGVCAR